MPKERTSAMSYGLGLTTKRVLILSIDGNVADCIDPTGKHESINVRLMRAKGQAPEVGETWLVNHDFGQWTFAAILDFDGQVRMVGEIVMYGGTAAPTGWLVCDGSAVSRADHAALFGVLGTRYGSGDGSTTFNVPNLAAQFPSIGVLFIIKG